MEEVAVFPFASRAAALLKGSQAVGPPGVGGGSCTGPSLPLQGLEVFSYTDYECRLPRPIQNVFILKVFLLHSFHKSSQSVNFGPGTGAGETFE